MSDRELLAVTREKLKALEDDLRKRGAEHLHLVGRRDVLTPNGQVYVTFRDKWTNHAWEITEEQCDAIVPHLPEKLLTAVLVATIGKVTKARALHGGPAPEKKEQA